MQGFVKQDPMNESDPPENPIRKFIMGPQIFAIIKAALMDPDMTYSPVDFINGTDFIISKTSKGGFSDYGTSKWARKESSLNEEMQDAIAQYGLVDLSTYLPKRPTPEQLGIIFEMFQASLEGELYDPAKWSQHYKPYGFDSNNSDDADGGEGKRSARQTFTPQTSVIQQTPVVQVPVTDTVVEEDDTPFVTETKTVTEPAPTAGKSPQEILAMLRNRKQ
jgi:hypothetical protein